jgi:4-amino-4-deoxy-L-arabinose transferase-like glycosyltransferase
LPPLLLSERLPGEPRSVRADILLLTLLIGGAYLLCLGHWPLEAPSEARYAEIPREMVASGDWLTPRLNGLKFFDKPPLVYWLQAVAIELFGRSEFAARLWTVAFGVGCCLAVYIAGARLWNRRAGWLAAVMLGSAGLYFLFARKLLLDLPVAFFLTVTFVAFVLGMQTAPESNARGRAMYLMYAAAAGAVLTKGLIGIVLPGMTVFAWLLITGRWHELRHVRLVTGTMLFLVIAAPWHIAVGITNPEFFWYYFVHEHFLRFTTSEHGRNQPAWFFMAVVMAGWLPWAVFLPAAIVDAVRDWWRERRQHDAELFVLLWFGLPFLFLSVSHSKLIPYALMLFPPLALLLGRYVDRKLDQVHAPLFGLLALGPFLLAVGCGVLAVAAGQILSANHQTAIAAAAAYLPWFAAAFAGIALAVALAAWRGAVGLVLAITFAGGLVAGAAGEAFWAKARPFQPVKALAETLNQRLRPEEEVASFATYYQDLPFYLNRIVTIVATRRMDLAFGASVEDVSAWMIDEDEFWRRWDRTDRTMYAVMAASRFATLAADKTRQLFVMARTGDDVLVTNHWPGEELSPPKP